ncbi:MAG: hypothetical protein HY940_04425 [Gammaproteobacteria bacterium]|nr:hypothetical protein [Gammaproteobacteria bacterium]
MSCITDEKFAVAYYTSNRKTGSISIVDFAGGKHTVTRLPVAAETGLAKELKPLLVGLTESRQVILLDPKTKKIQIQPALPADAFPAHIYTDSQSGRDWFMNDGDKETGNDVLNCGDKGSSVTIIENTASNSARYLQTLCVGRGHHQANFSYPSPQAPAVPRQAYISNLKDGTLSVIGNDPARASDYLQVLATINLAEIEREEGMTAPAVPNNSFPHGLVYSQVSGKVYNLNNGYGTVAVIDPHTHQIEQRLGFKGHSNLLITPDGRFIIGRGADRKSDPAHVLANLTVMDAAMLAVVDKQLLKDIYISKYFFNAEGSKLYLTTGVSGSDEQVANIKGDALLVFDLTGLPTLRLKKELRLGASSGSIDFLVRDGKTRLVLSSNSELGTLTVIDAVSDEILETVHVGDSASHSRVWVL